MHIGLCYNPPLNMGRNVFIFDWDGVVVNSDPINRYTIAVTCQDLGLPYTDAAYFENFAGRNLYDAASAYFTALGLPHATEPFIKRKREYNYLYPEWTEPYQDAMKLIACLGERGLQMDVVTGSREANVRTVMGKLGLEGAFTNIITAERYERGKPAPDAYRAELALLDNGTTPIVFEDTPSGLLAARLAGIDIRFGVTHTHDAASLSDATHIIDSLEEIVGRVGVEGNPRRVEF
jgi:beta-phosphoglucomutase